MKQPPARPLVVTWCSAKKLGAEPVRLPASESLSQSAAQARWRTILSLAPAAGAAVDLYQGRAFSLARDTARRAGADLSVVSAGLGWVTSGTAIPSYDLTVARGFLAGEIAGTFDTGAWWRAVVTGPFSTSPADDLKDRPIVLACVSQDYASFFVTELERVPPEKVRIFGSGLERKLPERLRRAVMPYDERLGSLVAGTRADFAQRALAHYLFTLHPTGDLERDAALVRDSMGELPSAKASPSRRQLSDSEIRALIKSLAEKVGSRTRMLRHLRDVVGVACEQGRFARLYSDVVGN